MEGAVTQRAHGVGGFWYRHGNQKTEPSGEAVHQRPLTHVCAYGLAHAEYEGAHQDSEAGLEALRSDGRGPVEHAEGNYQRPHGVP